MKNKIKLAKASLGAGLMIFTTGCGYYKQQSAQYEESTILVEQVANTAEKPVTEPLIMEPEYKIEDIANDFMSFKWYAKCLNRDLMQGGGMRPSYTDVTFGGRESRVALAMLNDGLISDDLLAEVFEDYSIEDFKNGAKFVYMMRQTQELFETDVDFSKYTIDPEIGSFINEMDDAYRNGQIYDFFYDKYMVGNITDNCLNHAAVIALTYSYDIKNRYLTIDAVDELVMNDFIDRLHYTVHDCTATGDINGDRIVDSFDMVLLRRAVIQQTTNTEYDINNDGKVNIADLVVLKNFLINGEKYKVTVCQKSP